MAKLLIRRGTLVGERRPDNQPEARAPPRELQSRANDGPRGHNPERNRPLK
jgi:hypothetical protein